MKAVNAKGQEVLAVLASLVPTVGDAVKIFSGAYMPLSIQRIRVDGLSVAHYYEQNGDLMADPEMTFWLGNDGNYYASGYRNDGIAQNRTSIFFMGGPVPVKFHAREQAGQSTFAGQWMQNLRSQGFYVAAQEIAAATAPIAQQLDSTTDMLDAPSPAESAAVAAVDLTAAAAGLV